MGANDYDQGMYVHANQLFFRLIYLMHPGDVTIKCSIICAFKITQMDIVYDVSSFIHDLWNHTVPMMFREKLYILTFFLRIRNIQLTTKFIICLAIKYICFISVSSQN